MDLATLWIGRRVVRGDWSLVTTVENPHKCAPTLPTLASPARSGGCLAPSVCLSPSRLGSLRDPYLRHHGSRIWNPGSDRLLVGAGHHVVGVDRHDADVCADLSTPAGRVEVIGEVDRMTGGQVGAVIASAGTSGLGAIDVRVDYFGAVATLDGLRPLLARASAPRAVAVVSFALVLPVSDALRCGVP